MGFSGPQGSEMNREAKIKAVGSKYGAPDLNKRTFFRALVDGRYKLVRWFSPQDYDFPTTVEDLYARSDVTLHDLENDPGELENIGNPNHPYFDPELVGRLLIKLKGIIRHEIGEDRAPFDLDLFGTRELRKQT